MTFLSMMIALALHQVVQPKQRFPGDDALFAWQAWLRGRVAAPGIQVLVTVIVPLLLLYWVLNALHGWLFGLPTLLATAAVLLWSLGREDYHSRIESFIAHRDGGDDEAAWLGLQALWMPMPPRPVNVEDEDTVAEDTVAKAMARSSQRLLYCGYQRWFAPLLYFLLLGPVAAAAYRVVLLYAARQDEARYRDLLAWIDWLPARLLALSFAVTGDFVAVARGVRLEPSADAPTVLVYAATAAVQGEPGGRDIRDLLYRTAGLWLVVASLFIILA